MSDLHTSYETSLALRDAGAPQNASQRKPRWCPVNRKHGHDEVMMSNYPQCERAFRTDEIIEALGDRLWNIERRQHEGEAPFDVGVRSRSRKRVMRYGCASLIEALAAAWLAVLKEGK